MARVLVTGVLGFFGSRIAELLRQSGYDVSGTTIHDDAQNEALFACDIVDPIAVNAVIDAVQPDIIIHAAAISSVTAGKPLDYYRVNTIGTENMLNAAAQAGGRRRFIFISTAGVYGNQDAELLTETLTPKPVHHYGMSKFAAERLVYNFSEFYDFTIIRPFNLIGPGQAREFILPKIVEAYVGGDTQLQLGNLDVYRDYLNVGCAAQAICDLIGCEASFGEVVNLCSGRPTSLRELLESVRAMAGREMEIVQAAEFIRKSEVWTLLGCPEKLHHLIGELKCKSIPETIAEMFSESSRNNRKVT